MASFSGQHVTARAASVGTRLFNSIVNAQQSELVAARAAVVMPFLFGGQASAGVAVTTYLMSGWSPELNQAVFWQSVSVADLSPSVTIPACVVGNIINKAVVVIY